MRARLTGGDGRGNICRRRGATVGSRRVFHPVPPLDVGRGKAFSGTPSLPVVMPGVVPGIHSPPLPRPLPARTAMPQDVDARNKSAAVRFNFGTGSVPTRRDRLHSPLVTPDLIRGPGKPGGNGACGPRIKSGVTAGEKDGGCGRAAIRVPIRRKGRKPACPNALHRVRPILTGQQWNKSGHDERG